MANILIIDDESGICALVKRVLEKDGHRVSVAASPKEVDMAHLKYYDLLILDVMMPEVDGFTWCRQIRDMVDCPILFLTAKTMESDVAEGLGAGGDDYIRKPFSNTELRARVAAHLRRENREHKAVLAVGTVRFDLKARTVTAHNISVNLTKSEYTICLLLAKHSGQVFSKEQIYDSLYNYEGEGNSNAVAEHIRNIRAKFKKQGLTPIETIWGIGYRWQ